MNKQIPELARLSVWDLGTEKQMIYKRGFGSSFYFWENSRSYEYQTNFL